VPLLAPALKTAFVPNVVACWDNYCLPFIINDKGELNTLAQCDALRCSHTTMAGSAEDFTVLTITVGTITVHAVAHHVPGP
jgi:ABC-type glycerol-3-phosphate transport system permease component